MTGQWNHSPDAESMRRGPGFQRPGDRQKALSHHLQAKAWSSGLARRGRRCPAHIFHSQSHSASIWLGGKIERHGRTRGMFGDIVEGLLPNPKQERFQPAGQTLTNPIGNTDGVPGRLQAARFLPQRGTQTEVVQARWPKTGDNAAQVRNGLARHSDQILYIVRCTSMVRNQIEMDKLKAAMKGRNLLGHAVVEVRRDGGPFIFLSPHDARKHLLELFLPTLQPCEQFRLCATLNVDGQASLDQFHQQSQGVSVLLRRDRIGVHRLREDDGYAGTPAFRQGRERNDEIASFACSLAGLDRSGGIASEHGCPLGCARNGRCQPIAICSRQVTADLDEQLQTCRPSLRVAKERPKIQGQWDGVFQHARISADGQPCVAQSASDVLCRTA